MEMNRNDSDAAWYMSIWVILLTFVLVAVLVVGWLAMKQPNVSQNQQAQPPAQTVVVPVPSQPGPSQTLVVPVPGQPGPQGQAGAPGAAGERGATGEAGAAGVPAPNEAPADQ